MNKEMVPWVIAAALGGGVIAYMFSKRSGGAGSGVNMLPDAQVQAQAGGQAAPQAQGAPSSMAKGFEPVPSGMGPESGPGLEDLASAPAVYQ